jgi:hypothetical protein
MQFVHGVLGAGGVPGLSATGVQATEAGKLTPCGARDPHPVPGHTRVPAQRLGRDAF